IRDKLVTGVQTCALPICLLVSSACAFSRPIEAQTFVNFESSQVSPVRLVPDNSRLLAADTPDARISVFDVATDPLNPRLVKEIRSEERRVGKECRSRCAR